MLLRAGAGPGSSNPMARADAGGGVEQTPSHFVMHTPTLNALVNSPVDASPLPADPLLMTPASRSMLRSMAQDLAVPSFEHCGLTPPRSSHRPASADPVRIKSPVDDDNAAPGPAPKSDVCRKRSLEAQGHLRDADTGDMTGDDKPQAARRLTFGSSDDGADHDADEAAGAMPPPPRPARAPSQEARSPMKRAKSSAGAGAQAPLDPRATVEPPTPYLPPGTAQAFAAAAAQTGKQAGDEKVVLARPHGLDLPLAQDEACAIGKLGLDTSSSAGKGSAHSSYGHVERGGLLHNSSNIYKSQLNNLMDEMFSVM